MQFISWGTLAEVHNHKLEAYQNCWLLAEKSEFQKKSQPFWWPYWICKWTKLQITSCGTTSEIHNQIWKAYNKNGRLQAVKICFLIIIYILGDLRRSKKSNIRSLQSKLLTAGWKMCRSFWKKSRPLWQPYWICNWNK